MIKEQNVQRALARIIRLAEAMAAGNPSYEELEVDDLHEIIGIAEKLISKHYYYFAKTL